VTSTPAPAPPAPVATKSATPGQFVDLGDGWFKEAVNGSIWVFREMQTKYPGARYTKVDDAFWRDNYTGWVWTKAELAARGVTVGN
jgi:hypothetical protein